GINNIGSDSKDNVVLAEIDQSSVSANGDIKVEADTTAKILSVAIAGSAALSASSGGSTFSPSAAGTLGVNKIRTNTQARVRNSSTRADGKLSVQAEDDSDINATAGIGGLSISLGSSGSSSGSGASLGASMTINDIAGATLAAIEDSDVSAEGAVAVVAKSLARAQSQAFGINISGSISGKSSALSLDATGALTFNTITNAIEATI